MPGPANDAMRAALERHLAYMLDQPLPQVPLDGALVEDARRTFSRIIAGRAGVQLDPALGRGDRAAAVASVRRAGRIGRAGVRAPLRQADDRRHPGLLHGGWLLQGAAAQPARRNEAGRRRKAGCWASSPQIDPTSPQVLNLQTDVVKLYDERLRQAVGRSAERHRCRAADQPAAGRAGAVRAVLAAVADARSAGRHHAAAYAERAAAASVRRRGRRRSAAGIAAAGTAADTAAAGAAVTGSAIANSAASVAAGSAASSFKGLFGQTAGAPPEPARQGDRRPLQDADRLRRQGSRRADRQRAEADERPAAAACRAGEAAPGAACRATGRRRRPGRSCCRPRQRAIRSRCSAGCRRWRSSSNTQRSGGANKAGGDGVQCAGRAGQSSASRR